MNELSPEPDLSFPPTDVDLHRGVESPEISEVPGEINQLAVTTVTNVGSPAIHPDSIDTPVIHLPTSITDSTTQIAIHSLYGHLPSFVGSSCTIASSSQASTSGQLLSLSPSFAFTYGSVVKDKLLQLRSTRASKIHDISTTNPEFGEKFNALEGALLQWAHEESSPKELEIRLRNIFSNTSAETTLLDGNMKTLLHTPVSNYAPRGVTRDELILRVEVVLNKIVNSQFYLTKSKILLNNCSAQITREFFRLKGNEDVQRHFAEAGPTHIVSHVSFIDDLTETHNGGRRPLRVTYKLGEDPMDQLELVCIPRKAFQDLAAMETFNELHQKTGLDSGWSPYVILIPGSGPEWAELNALGPISLSEYVPGPTIAQLYEEDIRQTIAEQNPQSEEDNTRLLFSLLSKSPTDDEVSTGSGEPSSEDSGSDLNSDPMFSSFLLFLENSISAEKLEAPKEEGPPIAYTYICEQIDRLRKLISRPSFEPITRSGKYFPLK